MTRSDERALATVHDRVHSSRGDGILLTSNFSNTTGFAWKFFRRLHNAVARRMHDRGFAVHLSFGQVQGEVTTVDADIPVGVVEFDLDRHDRAQRRKFIRFLRERRIRYVYFTDFHTWSPLFPRMRLAGVRRLVVHDHSSVADPAPSRRVGGARGLAREVVHRVPALSADAVYACSGFVRQRLVNHARCPDDRISVIHHGIDVDRFASPEPRPDADPVHIVLIARASREKGVHVLLRAVASLRQNGVTGFRVTYGGDGPELDDLKRLVATLGIGDVVRFAGEVRSTERLLAEADIVVVPSIWGDAAPLAVIEGMASGRALVVTRVGGIPEQVGDSGAALVVPPDDPGALAAALGTLMRDPSLRIEMGRRARLRATTAYREERFHREVVDSLIRDCGLD